MCSRIESESVFLVMPCRALSRFELHGEKQGHDGRKLGAIRVRSPRITGPLLGSLGSVYTPHAWSAKTHEVEVILAIGEPLQPKQLFSQLDFYSYFKINV